MEDTITYVAMDTHKKEHKIAQGAILRTISIFTHNQCDFITPYRLAAVFLSVEPFVFGIEGGNADVNKSHLSEGPMAAAGPDG